MPGASAAFWDAVRVGSPALLLVVFTAFAVESSIGFGATVVTVALGSTLMPLDRLLPAYIPVNLLLSLYLTLRYRADIDRSLLLRRIAPSMLVGIPAGLAAFRWLPSGQLVRVFAVLVVALAVLELSRLWRAQGKPSPPLPRALATTLLVLAGVVHGAFATGGPLAVYVAGRELSGDKARFRATLSGLWLGLGCVLFGSYVAMGRVDGDTAWTSLALLPALLLGIRAGEAVHARLPMRSFQAVVFVLLGAAGVMLLVRG